MHWSRYQNFSASVISLTPMSNAGTSQCQLKMNAGHQLDSHAGSKRRPTGRGLPGAPPPPARARRPRASDVGRGRSRSVFDHYTAARCERRDCRSLHSEPQRALDKATSERDTLAKDALRRSHPLWARVFSWVNRWSTDPSAVGGSQTTVNVPETASYVRFPRRACTQRHSARRPHNPWVAGSSPVAPRSQLAYRNGALPDVRGVDLLG
jgi:hypothetical protein